MIETQFRAVQDYPLNTLNKKNTYKDSGVVEFQYSGFKFGVGFYAAEWVSAGVTKTDPYLALIAWTPDGWQVIGRLTILTNDDLNMDMGNPDKDLETYAWYIGETFTKDMKAYMESKPDASNPATLPQSNWEKVRKFLETIRVINGKIVVDSIVN